MNRCSASSIKNALELGRLMRTWNDISSLLIICIILTTLKLYSHTLVRGGKVKDYVMFFSCDENLNSVGRNPKGKIKPRGKISHTPKIYTFMNKNFIKITLKFHLTFVLSGLMRKQILF